MKKILIVVTSVLLALNLVACGATTTTSEKDTLNIGLSNTFTGLNPFNSTEVASNWTMQFFYPTLLSQPSSTEFSENLAESFESDDNQTFTVTLRSDAKWSDGTPITVDDVLFTYNTNANLSVESSNGSRLSTIQGVDESGKLAEGETEISGLVKVSDTVFTITTKTAVDPAYIKENIGVNILIVPKHIVEAEDITDLASASFATAPTVTGGAYKFVKYELDSYVQLEAYADYYLGEPLIKNIYLKIMDSTGLVNSIQSGDIDMIAGGGIGVISVNDIATLKNVEGLEVTANPAFAAQYMYINNERFSSVALRQAIITSINRDKIVDELLLGDGEVTNSYLSSASPYYDTDLQPYAFDTAAAKALIAESGFDTTQTIKILVPTGNQIRVQSASLIEQDMEAAGFVVEQVSMDFASMLAQVKAGDYDLALIGLSLNVDPDISAYYTTTGSSNYLRLTDTALDDLFAEGKTLTSFEERKPVYDEIQTWIKEKAITVPLYSTYQYSVQTTALTGGIKAFWAGSLSDVHEWTLSASE